MPAYASRLLPLGPISQVCRSSVVLQRLSAAPLFAGTALRGTHHFQRRHCMSSRNTTSTATPMMQVPIVDGNMANPTAADLDTPTPTVTGGCPVMGTPAHMPCPAESASGATAACPFSGGQPAGGSTSCPMSGNVTDVVDGELLPKMSLYEAANILGKGKLSAFVTATATAGYVIAGGTSPFVAVALTAGTYLQSLSACTANQLIEVKYDRLMKRTARRPLVTGQIAKSTAAALIVSELTVGTAILAATCGAPTAAALGVINWLMYVAMYTPLKRVSATNTWWGALVGGVPPLMGGVAATAGILYVPASCASLVPAVLTPYVSTSAAALAAIGPAYLLAALMLAWQIPHFMALSFHCRRDYENAGFKMLAFKHPVRASSYAILLSVVMAGMMIGGPTLIGWPVEALWYYPGAIAANGLMIYKSVRFHQDPVRCCRSCFVFSYMYLAVMLVMLCLNHVQPVTKVVAAVEYIMAEETTAAAATTIPDQKKPPTQV